MIKLSFSYFTNIIPVDYAVYKKKCTEELPIFAA